MRLSNYFKCSHSHTIAPETPYSEQYYTYKLIVTISGGLELLAAPEALTGMYSKCKYEEENNI